MAAVVPSSMVNSRNRFPPDTSRPVRSTNVWLKSPGPWMSTGLTIVGRSLARTIAPVRPGRNVISLVTSADWLTARIASRRLPGPASSVFVTWNAAGTTRSSSGSRASRTGACAPGPLEPGQPERQSAIHGVPSRQVSTGRPAGPAARPNATSGERGPLTLRAPSGRKTLRAGVSFLRDAAGRTASPGGIEERAVLRVVARKNDREGVMGEGSRPGLLARRLLRRLADGFQFLPPPGRVGRPVPGDVECTNRSTASRSRARLGPGAGSAPRASSSPGSRSVGGARPRRTSAGPPGRRRASTRR